MTTHAFSLRDFNARQITRTQLHGGNFNALKQAWMYFKWTVGWIDNPHLSKLASLCTTYVVQTWSPFPMSHTAKPSQHPPPLFITRLFNKIAVLIEQNHSLDRQLKTMKNFTVIWKFFSKKLNFFYNFFIKIKRKKLCFDECNLSVHASKASPIPNSIIFDQCNLADKIRWFRNWEYSPSSTDTR